MRLLLLAGAAFAAGMLNAVAGGGAFIIFPSLVFLGVPPVSANATSAVALLPGQLASAWAYRGKISGAGKGMVKPLIAVSLIGGFLGALGLVLGPTVIFGRLVPWLMLFTTLLFAAGNFIFKGSKRWWQFGLRSVCLVQLMISVYGGYFGAGIGFLMLACFTFSGIGDIHVMNSLRVFLAPIMKIAAIVTFVTAGIVQWPEATVMALTSAVGGYAGAMWAKNADQRLIQGFIVLLGCILTAVFFIHPV